MGIDTSLVSEATVGIMQSINEKFGDSESGEIIAVGIICVVSDGDGMTFTRTYSTDKIHYRALGLFQAGVDVIQKNSIPEDADDPE